MRIQDVVRLVVLGAIWGSAYLMVKVALDGYPPVFIVFARFALGALTLLGILAARGIRVPRDRRTWQLAAALSVTANIAPFLLVTWGQQYIPSALGAILNSTTPLFTALLAVFALKSERITAMRATGLIVGFVGVSMIVGLETDGSLPGQLAVLLASALYGVGFVFNRRFLSGLGLSPIGLPTVQVTVGALALLPFAAWELSRRPPTFGIAPTLGVVGLGVLSTGLGFYIVFRLIADVGATTASSVTYLIPVFGVLLGWAVLDERIGWNTLVGGVVVILGIALAERRPKPAPRQETRPPVAVA